VITCPNTWSFLGEHSNLSDDEEGGRETVLRGLEEELGFVASSNFDNDDDHDHDDDRDAVEYAHAWTVELRPILKNENKTKKGSSPSPLRVTVRNATEFPLYYVRHYGARNEHRVDRQLTYLWIVRFPKRHEEIDWTLDEEVEDVKWVGLEEARRWLSSDAMANDGDGDVGGGSSDSSGGEEEDDGPDVGDFCHETIRSLYEVGLMNMI